MNFSPLLLKYFKIPIVLALHSNLPWVYFNLMPGNTFRNLLTKKIMELSIQNCKTLIVDSCTPFVFEFKLLLIIFTKLNQSLSNKSI